MLIVCPYFCHAQNQENQREVLVIKKDSKKYVYGEGTGQNEKDAYNIAKERLLFNVKRFVASNPNLNAANGIVLDKIQSKTKKLTYEGDFSFKVVCLYIKKDDIVPLFLNINGNMVDTEGQVEVKIGCAGKKSGEIIQNIPLSSSQSQKEDTIFESSDGNLSLADATDSSGIRQKMNKREKEIMNKISKMKTYFEIKEYLLSQKSNNHDIQFGLVQMALMRNHCYWLILTRDKKLIAIIDPNISINMLDNTKVVLSDYKNNPKIWLQINND